MSETRPITPSCENIPTTSTELSNIQAIALMERILLKVNLSSPHVSERKWKFEPFAKDGTTQIGS